MAFNFTDIIEAETKKQEEAASAGSGNNLGFKTVYPFNNGRLEFKFIGNEPSGLLYRELVFHEYWSDSKKQKVPCLHQMYGLDCPICNAVSNVQNTLDDKDVFGKYGFKRQGIMFAKLLGYSPDNYFGDARNNPPKVGDIVLFMFPKSVINELRNLIIEFQDEIENIFTNNSTRTVTLKIGTQANGFPEYTFYVKGNNDVLCVDTAGNPDQAAFNEFMIKMPNLKEVKFPSSPDENMMNIHRTIVEEINRKYFGDAVGVKMPNPVQMGVDSVHNSVVPPTNNIDNYVPQTSTVTPSTVVQAPTQSVTPTQTTAPVNSIPTAESPVAPNNVPIQETVGTANVAPTPTNNIGTEDPRGQRPPCFGNNEYNEKCSKCPWDNECV